jgi:hypothetical protein
VNLHVHVLLEVSPSHRVGGTNIGNDLNRLLARLWRRCSVVDGDLVVVEYAVPARAVIGGLQVEFDFEGVEVCEDVDLFVLGRVACEREE